MDLTPTARSVLRVIPEAAELVKAGFVVCCDRFSGRFRRVWGVRHPQPGSRRSARSAARTNGLEAGEDGAILTLAGAGRGGSRRGVQLSGSVLMVCRRS